MFRESQTQTLSDTPRPRLSIICTGRNDDRAPDQFERLISLQRTLAHALRKTPFEFLFIEWNPDPDRNYLGDALFLAEARHYVVTREAHKRLIADAQMSTRDGKVVKGERAFLLNHANNVGLKYARGEWVLITNLDDLFPREFGMFLETGESGALALGVHPRWSYKLLVRYRRAQRGALWRRCKSVVLGARRALKQVLVGLWWPVRLAQSVIRVARKVIGPCVRLTKRTLWVGRRLAGRTSYAIRSWSAPLRYSVRVSLSRARYHVVRGLAQPRATLRAIVVHFLGGAGPRRTRRQVAWWRRLRLGEVRRFLSRIPLVSPTWRATRLVGGALIFCVISVRHPRASGRRARRILRVRLRPVRRAVRNARMRAAAEVRLRGRALAKSIYDFIFAARVNWRVGRVRLTPGTLYRVRRQHVSDTFACRGANGIAVDDYVAEVEAEAVPGPWNNHFPWTWACGDFLLMDLATWTRIGGFPQQIGQLHADSVTIFRIVAEGCPVVLLDWNIYHMDHEDRFDAVPYVEYDFENVHRYFGPGWTKAEATFIDRTPSSMSGDDTRTMSAEPVLVAVGTTSVRLGEDSQ